MKCPHQSTHARAIIPKATKAIKAAFYCLKSGQKTGVQSHPALLLRCVDISHAMFGKYCLNQIQSDGSDRKLTNIYVISQKTTPFRLWRRSRPSSRITQMLHCCCSISGGMPPPPASKKVVKNLPSKQVTEEQAGKGTQFGSNLCILY